MLRRPRLLDRWCLAPPGLGRLHPLLEIPVIQRGLSEGSHLRPIPFSRPDSQAYRMRSTMAWLLMAKSRMYMSRTQIHHRRSVYQLPLSDCMRRHRASGEVGLRHASFEMESTTTLSPTRWEHCACETPAVHLPIAPVDRSPRHSCRSLARSSASTCPRVETAAVVAQPSELAISKTVLFAILQPIDQSRT